MNVWSRGWKCAYAKFTILNTAHKHLHLDLVVISMSLVKRELSPFVDFMQQEFVSAARAVISLLR